MKTNIALNEGTLIITCIGLVLLFLLYLYKKNNYYVLKLIYFFYSKPKPVPLPKNTVKSDLIILLFVIVIILLTGFKFITLVVVVSDSMVPEFQRGDIIVSQSIFLNNLKEGDIITFNVRNKNIAITHRIEKLGGSTGDKIITKGDNNPYKDDFKTTQENVLYKAIIYNEHPIIIKNLGSLFITDYSVEGRIYKYGDQFTFMQQLSATIRQWGYLLTVLALFGYLLSIKR